MSYDVNITFFKAATLLYLFAMVFYLIYLVFKKEAVGKVATGLTMLGCASHTLSIGIRWYESYQLGADIGHIPISNLFESMSFGAWTIVIIYLITEFKYKNRSFGAFVMPVSFLAMTYIFVAPNIPKEIEPLVPALKSYWLHIHVITSFLGYAAFAISFGVSLMFLIVNTKGKDGMYAFWTICIGALTAVMLALVIDFSYFGINPGKEGAKMLMGTFRNPAPFVRVLSYVVFVGILLCNWIFGMKLKGLLSGFSNSAEMLDDVGYKTIMVGFPLLTVGIITGAVWANSAWGTYWSWDPKETWSLITWFVYAAYLHARFTKGWRGNRAAVLSMVGFLAVIFTYLGVNLLLSGLHSYGSAG